MKQSVFCIFTRTPMHVGAGNSVGAVDSPVMRERHTGFPVIPGSSIKGVLRDAIGGDKPTATWLFGSDDANNPSAGAIQCGEARLLAFPVRSAKGCFAWITSPLILGRFIRDTGISDLMIPGESASDSGYFAAKGKLAIGEKTLVLEDYTVKHAGELPDGFAQKLTEIMPNDPAWADIQNKLVIVSDEMMSHFAVTACEVAQHIRIDDATGTAAHGALFNQENVPSETLFYGLVYFFDERRPEKDKNSQPRKKADDAEKYLLENLPKVLQFGADAGTGLGYCSVEIV